MLPTSVTIINYNLKSNSELWGIIASHKKQDMLKRGVDGRAYAAYCVLDSRTPSKQPFNLKTR